jgi:hypothetical protein
VRATSIERVVLKAEADNIPDWIRDGSLGTALGTLGVELRVDELPGKWPDFTDTDIVLCARRLSVYDRPEDAPTCPRKPPTKLINAWAAGAIPIISPETGYLDIAHPGVDALLADGPDEIVATVAALRSDPERVARLLTASVDRGNEFAPDAVLDRWMTFLQGDLGPSRRRAALATVVIALPAAFVMGIVRRVRPRFSRRRP